MTHKDIYTKFMIEYDKAGASTSYPSLTEYEVATVLDKAYNALIAQKVTGNNVRRSTVESDIKSIADLGPLTKSKYLSVQALGEDEFAQNVSKVKSPADLLYFLQGSMKYNDNSLWTPFDNDKGKDQSNEQLYKYNPVDGKTTRSQLVKLVNHEIAQKFFASASNIPWIKNPVCFIEDRDIYIVYDPLNPPIANEQQGYAQLTITTSSDTEGEEYKKYNFPAGNISALNYLLNRQQDAQTWFEDLRPVIGPELASKVLEEDTIRIGLSETSSDEGMSWYKIKYTGTKSFRITYIRRPNTFVKDLTKYSGTVSYFDDQDQNLADYQFECNSTVAEELVSLAVAFALENVESQRLNSKLNMRGLEA